MGSHLECETGSQQYLEAILTYSDALSFALEDITHLLAGLIVRLQRRKNLSDRPIGSERFGQCARANASFASVLADDIREYLWAADLSLRAFLDDF